MSPTTGRRCIRLNTHISQQHAAHGTAHRTAHRTPHTAVNHAWRHVAVNHTWRHVATHTVDRRWHSSAYTVTNVGCAMALSKSSLMVPCRMSSEVTRPTSCPSRRSNFSGVSLLMMPRIWRSAFSVPDALVAGAHAWRPLSAALAKRVWSMRGPPLAAAAAAACGCQTWWTDGQRSITNRPCSRGLRWMQQAQLPCQRPWAAQWVGASWRSSPALRRRRPQPRAVLWRRTAVS